MRRATKTKADGHSVGVAMTGGNPIQARHPSDFYPTPVDVTQALLNRFRPEGLIWEPCCGDGAMARVIEEYQFRVLATDLHDRGYGEAGHDILKASRLLAPNVITNPPFRLAAPIIEHLLPMRPRFMALTLKATFWSAQKRTRLFKTFPPSWVLPLNWRPDFNGGGCPTMELMWTVWQSDYVGPTRFDVLSRPGDLEVA